jgi:hypothetical protein
MKRRDWLQNNPPPKAAASLRELLAALNGLKAARQVHETNKQTYAQHVLYWNQQGANARQLSDAVSLNHANSQLADVQAKIAEIDRALVESAQVPARISELEAAEVCCRSHKRSWRARRNVRSTKKICCDKKTGRKISSSAKSVRTFICGPKSATLPDSLRRI